MKSKILCVIGGAALIAIFVLAISAVAQNRNTRTSDESVHSVSVATKNADPLSGEWNLTFHVRQSTTTGKLTLKLNGSKVTGTVHSSHTGDGTVHDGRWTHGKLSLRLVFTKHEPIVIKGALQDGKLAGEFWTEGFTDKWEATRNANEQ